LALFTSFQLLLLFTGQETFPARNAMDAHVQGFIATNERYYST